MQEKKEYGRRWRIRTSAYIMTVVLVLGISSYQGFKTAQTYKNVIENSYQRALSELTTNIENIKTALHKGVYANTRPMVTSLAASLWRQSSGAKSNLGQLPVSELALHNTFSFLSQVGEFAMSLSRKIGEGGQLDEQDRQQLNMLAGYADGLAKNTQNIRAHMDDGTLRFGETQQALQTAHMEEGQDFSLADGLSNAEEAMTDYPTLVYDGPFSSSILNKNSPLVQGSGLVSRETARRAAAEAVGVEPREVKDAADEMGLLENYCFSVGDTHIAVTQKGGYLCYFLNPRYAEVVKLDEAAGVEKARAYLQSLHFSNMKESYYMVANGILTVNFAFTQDAVTCYPDLIHVSVALDTGEIVSADMRGYLMNHTARELREPTKTLAQAKESLSPYLNVIDTRMAVIPMDTGREAYCYEFHCIGKADDELLVYIDTQTGEEAQILLLLYSDEGTLTL